MKIIEDSKLVNRLAREQGGVFTTVDLRTALAEPHASEFGRRLRALQKHGVLSRFTRGFYVTEPFELPVLSQRIAPGSCISFETILARELVIGPKPIHRIVATKIGRTRRYANGGFEIEHLGISPQLMFGNELADGVRYANVEKAVLDTLYFHLRGRRYSFDIYSDMNLTQLDRDRLRGYLEHYRNPKFVAFATRILELG